MAGSRDDVPRDLTPEDVRRLSFVRWRKEHGELNADLAPIPGATVPVPPPTPGPLPEDASCTPDY